MSSGKGRRCLHCAKAPVAVEGATSHCTYLIPRLRGVAKVAQTIELTICHVKHSSLQRSVQYLLYLSLGVFSSIMASKVINAAKLLSKRSHVIPGKFTQIPFPRVLYA